MFRVTREIDFCYGHRLLNYEGKCRYLHGHNGRAVISIEGNELDFRGMVLDFSDKTKTVDTIEQHYFSVDQERKYELLLRLLEREQPEQDIGCCRNSLRGVLGLLVASGARR